MISALQIPSCATFYGAETERVMMMIMMMPRKMINRHHLELWRERGLTAADARKPNLEQKGIPETLDLFCVGLISQDCKGCPLAAYEKLMSFPPRHPHRYVVGYRDRHVIETIHPRNIAPVDIDDPPCLSQG